MNHLYEVKRETRQQRIDCGIGEYSETSGHDREAASLPDIFADMTSREKLEALAVFLSIGMVAAALLFLLGLGLRDFAAWMLGI